METVAHTPSRHCVTDRGIDLCPVETFGRWVLVVEAEELMGKSLQRAMTASNHHVTLVTSAMCARLAVARCRPDIVIVGLLLTDDEPQACCLDLRRRNAELPIVMLTSSLHESRRIEGPAGIAIEVVGMPFRLAELLEVVANLPPS